MKNLFSTLIFVIFLIPAKAQSDLVKTAGCIEGNCDEGTGKYLFANGDKFNGEWHGGMRTGYGRYDYENGDWYIGDFKNDIIEGKGVIHLASGEAISGELVNYVLVKVDDQKFSSRINMKLTEMQTKKN